MSKFNVGDKVRYINTDHDTKPEYYPPYGTIGVFKGNNWVQWPIGVTSGDGCWSCDESDIELVVEDMTNEEIWEMLRPKMEKNGLISNIYSCTKVDDNGFPCFFLEEAYKNKDVHNAIAIAYHSGYERAMKGRPFKIGEKKVEEKKGGHWEPVDPNNLPKEGTKVRYSRHIDDKGGEFFSKWTGIQIGEMTTVRKVGNEFWVEDIHNKNNGYPVCSYLHPERFDMWVEDDE